MRDTPEIEKGDTFKNNELPAIPVVKKTLWRGKIIYFGINNFFSIYIETQNKYSSFLHFPYGVKLRIFVRIKWFSILKTAIKIYQRLRDDTKSWIPQ